MFYNGKITAKKFLTSLIAVVIVGGISVWQDDPTFLIVLPILKALENYLKNKL